MEDLVFEDPPPARKSPVKLGGVAEALRMRPREWARIGAFKNASMIASNIKRGKPKEFEPAGSFEAVSRKLGDDNFLWVRYVGEPVNGATEQQES